MDAPSKEAQKTCIVVGYDFSEGADVALEEAVRIARDRERAVIRVVTVGARLGDLIRLEHNGHVATVAPGAAAAALDLHVSRSLDLIAPPGTMRPNVSCHAAAGSPAAEIIRFAREHAADLIVVGTHGRHGLGRFITGSVAEKVARAAPCPVLVARRKRIAAPAATGPRRGAVTVH